MSKHCWGAMGLTVALFGLFLGWQQRSMSPAPAEEIEKGILRPSQLPKNVQTATFAGGCFWGVEEIFRTIPGVLDTHAGYTGGTSPSPTYETVHADKTGHVEAVEVRYDPTKVTYAHLLETFFGSHNPTLPDKSGQAIGKSYRSFIFTHGPKQEDQARAMIRTLTANHKYPSAPHPIVTRIVSAGTFWPAEEHHQRYYEKRGITPACRF